MFYEKVNVDGIMKAIPSIEDINDEIKVQERLLEQAHDDEWQSIISGDDIAIKASKRNREMAEQKVKDKKLSCPMPMDLAKVMAMRWTLWCTASGKSQ